MGKHAITPQGVSGTRERGGMSRRNLLLLGGTALAVAAVSLPASIRTVRAQTASARPPNILILWGDDIGYWNVSAYNQGMMGYKTPNIDRIAREGGLFTDYYGQQSCTAGRAAFITGQSPYRTGLLKVGLPGAKEGMQAEDPTLAELLKPHGYMTGQFGKNHLGDRDEHLPTAHGFDEFFGSLYHLNAEDEPEHPDYPKNPEFREKFGPRGVLHSYADGRIENTGPLTKKRMETIDQEVTDAAIGFLKRAKEQDKPFFLWWNSTRMHVWTRLKAESQGKTGLGIYPDGMTEHDEMVGQMLKALDDLGLAENTIVMYSTDNGAEKFTWPDGGQSPFRGEKNTNWEGGFRVPCAVRWPGTIAPGTIYNEIVAHEDWIPTLVAAAGEPQIRDKLLAGYTVGPKTFKVHLDGYNITDYLAGARLRSAPRIHLLRGRRHARRPALRPMEDRFCRATRRRARCLARAIRAIAASEALQPSFGSFRNGRSRGHGLRTLASRTSVRHGAGTGLRCQVPRNIQGVPAAAKAGQLLYRPSDGEPTEFTRGSELGRGYNRLSRPDE